MTEPVLRNYIGGRWQASKSSLLLDVEDPAEATAIARAPVTTSEEVDAAVRAAQRAFLDWRGGAPPGGGGGGGKWPARVGVEAPAEAATIARVPVSTPAEVDAAVRAAQTAFLEWRQVPPPERVQPLFRLKQLLEERREELAATITCENGKTLEEARGEVRRTIDNVEVACGIPSLMQGRSLPQIARGIDEVAERVPLGVFAVIPPFNFPAMVPSWFWPYAVACGNAAILKPSELVPVTSQRLFELIDEAGFPPGVLSLVNGDRTVSEQLITHPGVAGISSVTSTPTAKAVYALAAQHGKRVQCGGGAKNFIIVMPDADLEKSVPNIMDSVYGSAGQRCLAGSNVVAIGSVAEPAEVSTNWGRKAKKNVVL